MLVKFGVPQEHMHAVMHSSILKAIILYSIFFKPDTVLPDPSFRTLTGVWKETPAEADSHVYFPKGVNKSVSCLPDHQIPVQGVPLTGREWDLLPSLCWRLDRDSNSMLLSSLADRGVPQGVHCNVTTW